MTGQNRWGACMALAAMLAVAGAWANTGQVQVAQLPEALKQVWERTKPEMTDRSACAAAFDGNDGQRMTLQCSVHIRMRAEGERRALRRCEDKRQELGIRNPCRFVVE